MTYNILEFDSSNIKILNDIETISGKIKVNGIDKFHETSNFIISTSNIISNRIADLNTDDITDDGARKKYIVDNIYSDDLNVTGSFTINGIDEFHETSNFIISTSNIISNLITNLNTDDILSGTTNKYIVGNIYSDDLTVNGDFAINGTDTTINSALYSSNLLKIVNSSVNTALSVNQNDPDNDVINASNLDGEIFKIKSNGNIGIGTNPGKKLDVFGDIRTSSDIIFSGKLYKGEEEFITSYWLRSDDGTELSITSNVTITGELITSNLTVHGTTTTLNTDVYTTEQVDIQNSAVGVALNVTQNNGSSDIVNFSNGSKRTFTIRNDGGVVIDTETPSVSLHILDTGGIIIPVGTESQRPSDTKGTIRYNDDTSQFEGCYGSAWGSLGGVKDISGNTYISAQGNVDEPLAVTNQLSFYSNGVNRMLIDSNGDIGIGTTEPAQKLHVNGQIIATNKITSFYSDERLKTDIELIPEPLNIIEQLNGFYYKANELAESFGIETNKKELGLSAQEVNKVLPELVDLAPFDTIRDENDDIVSKSGENYLTISYERLMPVIVESIKQLNNEIKLLKEENQHLKEAIKKMS
jgi:chaperonin cofactor prefoldin